jgi:hypothetical protein
MTKDGKKVWKELEKMGWSNEPKDLHLEYYEDIITATKKALGLAHVSVRLSSSLGECVEGNDYEIVPDKNGRFWINHKEIGSGEPLEQWIDSVLNVR